MKTPDESFRDWEGHVFGLGYGTGEEHTLAALKNFFTAISERDCDYRVLEQACHPQVAWLLINTLCKADIIEYGTSPRFGWLTPKGERLKAYLDAHSLEELQEVLEDYGDDAHCYPDACNCGPYGYNPEAVCVNPFWTNPLPPAESGPSDLAAKPTTSAPATDETNPTLRERGE